MRKIKNRKRLYLTILIVFIVFAGFIKGLNNNIEITKYDIYDKRIERSLKLYLLQTPTVASMERDKKNCSIKWNQKNRI